MRIELCPLGFWCYMLVLSVVVIVYNIVYGMFFVTGSIGLMLWLLMLVLQLDG